MADTTLTLVLEGRDIPLGDFTEAVTRFRSLVEGVTKQAKVDGATWFLDELSYGSATMATRAEIAQGKVAAVRRAYIDVGVALEQGDDDRLPASLRKDATAIFGLLNGHVEAVRFETEEDEITV